MAIEHKTLTVKTSFNNNTNFLKWEDFLNYILSVYDWNDKSSVTISQDSSYPACYKNTFGKYYFTENSYLSFDYYANTSSYLGINLVTPNGTKRIAFTGNWYTTLSVGKTSKGVCIYAYSGGSSENRDSHFYNLYVGEITLADGTITKGCIYVADNNSHDIATDSGISEEAAFNSVIDSTRKGYLIPVTDSTTGAVFSDIYLMACAPVQYNKFKIADTGNKYLAGKAICLAD